MALSGILMALLKQSVDKKGKGGATAAAPRAGAAMPGAKKRSKRRPPTALRARYASSSES
mgnify:CR=1 FL=1